MKPRDVDVAEQDSHARSEVKTSSSSPKLGGNEGLPASLHSSAYAVHEECSGDVHTRGIHGSVELDHISQVNLPSFDSPAQLLGSSVQAFHTFSRHHESFVTLGSHGTARSHVSEEESAHLLDEASAEADNANDVTSPDVSNEEKSSAMVLMHGDADASKKRKLCATPATNGHAQSDTVVRKARKRPVNVWAKSSSRKGGKRNSKNGTHSNSKNGVHENLAQQEDCVYLTLPSKHQDKIEDGPDMPVLLSKFHKAEKIELSEDRLSAGNTKGYRMVRATRGVTDGAWYFEILVEKLGPSGHTRLGWSTQKGEIQAPVGFDNYSYAYRDVDGSKVHMAAREPYGDPYVEGDVIGFYIYLPNGAELAPKPASLVSYRGQPYILDEKEEPPKIVPGSEIAFFKNGNFQGTAFKDISAGRYFPAASMYTLPDAPKCIVKFQFGPEFRFPPKDIGDRPMPQPIACAQHCGMETLGFGSLDWKSESSRVKPPTCTLEPPKTGENDGSNFPPTLFFCGKLLQRYDYLFEDGRGT